MVGGQPAYRQQVRRECIIRTEDSAIETVVESQSLAIAVSLIIDVGIPIGIVGPRQGHRALRRRGWGAVPDGGAAGLPRVPHRVACQLLLRGLAGDLSHMSVHLLATD